MDWAVGVTYLEILGFFFHWENREDKRVVWNDDVLHATYILVNRKSNKLFQNVEKGK